MGPKELSLRVIAGEVLTSNRAQFEHITVANMILCAVQINAYSTIPGILPSI